MKRIYSLVDPRDGIVRYVGATSLSLKDRLRAHLSGLNNKRKRSVALGDWLRQLYSANVQPEIIELQCCDDADEAEKFWISKFRSEGVSLLNVRGGGSGKSINPRTEEVCARLRENNLGKKHSAEARAKMSASRKGRSKSAAHRKAIGDAHRGSKHTPEHCANSSAALKGIGKGVPKSPEHRAKLAEHLRRLAAARKRPKPWV